MTRPAFIGGNWKCNGSIASLSKLLDVFNEITIPDKTSVVIGCPAIYIPFAISHVKNGVQIAAQNCWKSGGAFTGEISCDMLKDVGVQWVILGHSERRQIFGESDKLIGEKVKIALEKGLKVIACIGETLEEREANKTESICETQLSSIIANVTDSQWKNVVIAYEPVWAIGTGKTATSKQAQDVHFFIRSLIESKVGKDVADNVQILYGGSVKPSNAKELISQPDVDGFLVGGASLEPSFTEIMLTKK